MDPLQVKTSHFVSRPDPRKLIVASVLLPLQHNDGHIFALIKILGHVDEQRQRVAVLIEDHLKRFQQTLTEQVNIPRRFEQILQAINEDIRAVMSEGTRIPFSDLHAAIGVFHEHQMFLSGVGNLSALFMHRTAKQRYVIYELDQQFDTGDANWEKVFITVLDGELHPGDVFYLGTRLSGRELSIGDLQDILITLPPSGALKRIQQHVHIGSAYGGVALQVVERIETGPPKKTNPFSSIEQLGKTKEETAELLGEQSPDVVGWINSITSPIMKALSSPGTKGRKSTAKRVLRLLLKTGVGTVIFLFTFLKRLFTSLQGLYHRLRNRSLTLEPATQEATNKKSHLTRLFEQLTTLPPVTKYIALGVAVVCLLLIGTLSLVNSKTQKKDAHVAYETIVTRIEEKRNAAEASLIYDDKDQARRLLAEAVALLESLPTDTREQGAGRDALRSELNAVFYNLRGVSEVTVQTLATLETPIVQTVEANGTLYSFTSQNVGYRLNELTLTYEPLNLTNGSVGEMTQATGEGSNVLFVDANQRLGRVDTTTASIAPLSSGVESLESADDVILYNENLYVLSRVAQQIYRHRPVPTGFEAGTAWITSLTSSLASARALAVDGDIYVLLSDRILRFNSGKELTFAFETVDPVLKNPVDISTTVESEYVYVLEPDEARVLVYDKTGGLTAQYVNEAFRSGTDLVLREDKATIMIGTTSGVIQFTATHLVQ